VKKANDSYKGHSIELREAERIARQHDIERRIQEENEEFTAMTPAQKRVRIAQDVLEWMKFGRIVATNGEYMSVVDERDRQRKASTVNGFTCHACALGSVFAVSVERGLATPTRGSLNNTYDEDMRNKLGKHFDERQLLMIEDAFEGFGASNDARATGFCADIKKYKNVDGISVRDPDASRLRMERIMNNIIANDGTFVP
jgi:hypothetical protein